MVFNSKRGVITTDKIMAVVIIAALIVAVTPIILTEFFNLSTTGILLANLFSVVLGVIFAVAVFKVLSNLMTK